jgi:hypothetical protein
VVATNEIAAAGYSVNAYESCYELALPLTALGPTRSPGLAVEVSYGLPQ